MCDIHNILINTQVGYTFFTINPKMTFKQEGYKEYKYPLIPYQYRNFSKENNFLSVCIKKENLLFSLPYGDRIIKTLYPRQYVNSLNKNEYHDLSNTYFGEFQIQRFYTGKESIITTEIFNEILLFADNMTLKKFFDYYVFIDCDAKNLDDYFYKYSKLGEEHKKVSELYFESKDIWEKYYDIYKFKEELKRKNISKSHFFDKEKFLKKNYRKYRTHKLNLDK